MKDLQACPGNVLKNEPGNGLRDHLKSVLKMLPELLFPRRCPLCDGLLSRDERYLCRACARDLPMIRGPVCLKCGRPVRSGRTEYCENCGRREHLFTRGFAPYVYADAIQASVMRFKYQHRAEYASFYAASILLYGESLLKNWKIDVIVPVPIHTKRYRKRGYNQAEEIAVRLSELSGIPCDPSSVFRVKNTAAQKGLDPSQRRKNLQNAFRVSDQETLKGKRILIVDDIYTTGTTVDSLAACLLSAGAAQVFFAAASIAAGAS